MMTGELKGKIEKIWDLLWAAGMTNPLTIAEQVTYLLFVKIIDENELKKEAAAKASGMPAGESAFDGEHQNCRWHVFRTFEPEAMFRNMTENVFPFIKGGIPCGKDAAYSKYLKDALFLIPNARVLARVVEALDAPELSRGDIMGDVYEVLLSRMAQSGKNGQFRTPRHIAEMIVELAAPALEDEICDPAMGSAGFLCAATRYLARHYKTELRKKENREKFNTTLFTGFDTDQTMLRIGAMNLMLHGVEEPQIAWQDSLSADNACRDKFSLILANPPFAGSVDGETLSKDLREQAGTAKTELLFLWLFLRMLRVGGRCVSIVPNGVLANTSHAHLAIRKEIVENQRLEAVISMPSGVFFPYSGVSTAILIFTKTNCGGTDKVWFYKMKADGLSLDPARLPVEENDIPDVIRRFRHLQAEEGRERTEQSFFVGKQEIVDNGYTFSFGRYCAMKVDDDGDEPTEERILRLKGELAEMFEESHRLEAFIQKNLDDLAGAE